MQRDLSLELIGKEVEGLLLMERLLGEPQVVEPADDAVVELVRDVTQSHERLDRVQLSCDRRKCNVKVYIAHCDSQVTN